MKMLVWLVRPAITASRLRPTSAPQDTTATGTIQEAFSTPKSARKIPTTRTKAKAALLIVCHAPLAIIATIKL